MIDAELLTVLDAITRHGSLAQAARSLDRVPSALSYTVRQYEERLDLLLIDRRGHRAKLTPAAQTILENAAPVLAQLGEIAQRAQTLASGWEPELRIAVDEALCFERVLTLIDRFYALAMPTRITIQPEVLSGTWDALLEGRATLALGAVDGLEDANLLGNALKWQALGDMQFVFCVAPHHPLASETAPIPDTLLAQHRSVAVADTARRLNRASFGIQPRQDVLTVASMQHKIAAQVRGSGVGWLPLNHVRDLLASGQLLRKAVQSERPPARFSTAWRRGAEGNAVRWFRRLLADPAEAAALLG